MADYKLSSIYYSPCGYWRGLAAVKKLSAAAKVSEAYARSWLKRQAVWQIYLPARGIFRDRCSKKIAHVRSWHVHRADLLFLPHDRVGRKTYTYALTVVDVASRYNEAEP